ncbi:Transcriptional activator SPT7 [Lachnellula cervina]|uniref:SAGA complex subunit Spt7 n=1 Tax=Lachnellula cervina TaxID=1316786 RepID=A0A7D8YT86_9HELO|nr:Transcriptional activator SPT7 [Lachnellula cervina]
MSTNKPFSSARASITQPWPPPTSLLKNSHHPRDDTPARSNTNTPSLPFDDASMAEPGAVIHSEGDIEEEHQKTLFKELYRRSEAKISELFGGVAHGEQVSAQDTSAQQDQLADEPNIREPPKEQAPKKAARTIDEDNYDDEDDDEEEEEDVQTSPLKNKSANALLSPSKSGSSPVSSDTSPTKPTETKQDASTPEEPKSSEDARKELEEERKATEEAAKRSFHTIFYTLENDRVAMLEQQRLEEAEKQINAEMDNSGNTNNSNAKGEQHGTLSSANLGASSLTLKHLIARIDLKREKVKASDAELRALMNEVRKNRSKWASEENVNQEELYEAIEKVLSELKAMTEYSAPFLTRVNKREAPDYYNIIKTPMDLGTMTKKLKQQVYKSKADFVADLDLIWSNCLKYNADIAHPLRRNANSMRKEAEKLIPLIPDLVIRPRAEVEAEERRKQNGGEDDAGDDSDDEPIMSSRGRKAGAKGSSKTRNAAPERDEGTPGVDQKPSLQVNGLLSTLGHEGSDAGFDSNGFGTPPIGSITPSGFNGMPGVGSQADGDIDGPSMNGLSLGQALGAAAEDLREDEEYKIWKQVTKKDRAFVAKERNRLFKGDKLNPEEPALMRSKAGMRRWIRQQKQAQTDTSRPDANGKDEKETGEGADTLAEGMEAEEERVLPDYYDPLSAIPDINPRLQWVEDSDGNVIDQQSEDFLRMIKPGHFTAPKGFLSSKVDANMKQMQETRKLTSKISVIKQMQLQAQMYNNQFPKYEPEPFVEADIEPHVMSDDGPVMAPWVCKAAMQRSVAKLCYHAGFEELQPSALDVITDAAADYFEKLARTINVYREAPQVPAIGAAAVGGKKWQERYTDEEVILHSLSENGIEVEALESYVKDDVERFGGKLGVMHERMKAHLSDLLRPALADNSADGSGQFNDGSEQFVGGDFAEELGEDFFGFKALGLDSEFGMSSLSVPLHLLHAKIHKIGGTGIQAEQATTTDIFPPPTSFEPVTKENLPDQIGLVRNFFLAKLHANEDEPLLEDEDLPTKQKPPKPRLGPTGKITSPRKRPLKEQTGNAKKKKKLDNGTAMDTTPNSKTGGVNASPEKGSVTASAKKLKLGLPNGGPVSMERADSSQGNASQTEKDDVGMISPESIER